MTRFELTTAEAGRPFLQIPSTVAPPPGRHGCVRLLFPGLPCIYGPRMTQAAIRGTAVRHAATPDLGRAHRHSKGLLALAACCRPCCGSESSISARSSLCWRKASSRSTSFPGRRPSVDAEDVRSNSSRPPISTSSFARSMMSTVVTLRGGDCRLTHRDYAARYAAAGPRRCSISR